jgi:HPt (histidine-containing phosphotransfer) domain-containing protein
MELENIEELPILDKQTAITDLGEENLFFTMIEGFEEMSLRKNLTALKIAFDDLDYYNIRAQAHSLKGASSYIHAERVKTAAERMQYCIEHQLADSIFKVYSTLIQQCIILKRKIRSEVCRKNSKISGDYRN